MLSIIMIDAFQKVMAKTISCLVLIGFLYCVGYIIAKMVKALKKDKTPTTHKDVKKIFEKKVSWLTVIIVIVGAWVLFMLLLSFGTK